MDEYEDSDEYSAGNSFRARSNTWPLNRPEPLSNQVNIDEPLPEIQLEDEDLFTTNENWSEIDHDIMSWDPILNAQNISNLQTSTSHLQNGNQTRPHLQRLQHHLQSLPHHHHHHHHHQQQQQQQQQQHNDICHQQQVAEVRHDTLLSGTSPGMLNQMNTTTLLQEQQAPIHHQTLNSNCFQNSDPADDPNEYHIRQLHQLRLSNQATPGKHHYMSTSLCMQSGEIGDAGVEGSYLSSGEHHQLQPLPYNLETSDADNNEGRLNNNTLDNDHLHQLRPVLDRNQPHHHSQLLSSSLNSREIGMSNDLDADLEFKSVDPSAVLSGNRSSNDNAQLDTKQQSHSSNSSTNIKNNNNKLNTPRRNAWGNMSYADLISQAINSTNDKRLTLSQIYDWMVQHVPYFKDKGDSNSSAGWKNSVRHNLSLHNRFKRIQNEGTGKSSWWTINPEANVGKCARRRAASMEASKYEKKRRGAKKRADAIRSGLVSYSSLTNASLPNSFSLEQSMNQLTRSNSTSISNNNNNKNSNNKAFSDDVKNSELCRQQQQPTLIQANNPGQQQSQQQIKYEIENHSQPSLHSQTSSPPSMQQQQQPQQQQTIQDPTSKQQNTSQQQLQSHQNHQQRQLKQESPSQLQPLIQSISNQHLQTHQIQTKLHAYDTNPCFIQTHHIQQHPQQIMNQTDHMDLFGRHAIYMSEPCNDCNCTDQLINCGNALSLI